MNRTEIINFFIEKHKFQRYLEIGVSDGWNIEKVKAIHKDGVDPGPAEGGGPLPTAVNYVMTSDSFFETIKNQNTTYDFIFIDGLHHSDQVDADIFNSLNALSDGGIIMLHDSLPPSYEHQLVPRMQDSWCGDVWKSIVKLRLSNPNLEIFTIDTDYGCTILKRGKQKIYDKVNIEAALNWNYFIPNKKELINIISVEEFIKKES
jgi:hypothetical protein